MRLAICAIGFVVVFQEFARSCVVVYVCSVQFVLCILCNVHCSRMLTLNFSSHAQMLGRETEPGIMGLTLETLFHEISARKDQIYKVTLSYLEVCRSGRSACSASMQNCFSIASTVFNCLPSLALL